MRKKLLVALLTLTLGVTSQSQAAFVPKAAEKIETVTTRGIAQEQEANSATAENANSSAATTTATETKAAKKHSFVSRLFTRLSGKAAVSQAAYIVLSIFFLGWLAIGLNDGFEGFSWVLDLILYILLWLPGFIYAMLVMGKYY